MLSRTLIVPFYWILLVLGITIYACAPSTYSPSYLGVTLLLAVFAVCVWCTRKEACPYLSGRTFLPSSIFIVGFLIVHFQADIDLLLGFADSNLYRWGPVSAVNKAAALSLCGLIAFFLGMLRRVYPSNRNWNAEGKVECYTLFPSTIFCFGLFILFLATVNWSFFQGGHLARMGGNDEAAMGSIAVYIDMLLQAGLLVPLFFYLRTIFSQRLSPSSGAPANFLAVVRGLGPLYLGILSTYSFLMLLSGRRSVPLAYFLALVFVFLASTRRKTSIFLLGLVIFVGGLFMYGVGIARTEVFYEAPLSEKVEAGWAATKEMLTGERASVSPATVELASSVRSLHIVVDQVPTSYPYTYGRMALANITSAVPFLNSQVLGQTLYAGMIPSSASYATYIDQGDRVYSGIGSTIILDFFFDGGIFPVIIGMFIVGFMFRRVEVYFWSDCQPPLFWMIAGLCIFVGGFFSTRGSFVVIAKQMFYLWIFILCLRRVSLAKKPS